MRQCSNLPPNPLLGQQSRPSENDVPYLRTPIGARLHQFWEEWKSRGAEAQVIEVLRLDYTIPFVERPPLAKVPIRLTAYSIGSEKFLALEKKVISLAHEEVIEEAHDSSEGYYNRLFVVPKASGGWRPVLDVSALNRFMLKTKFKMKTQSSVLAALSQGDWMVSLDMQDAYFHVPSGLKEVSPDMQDAYFHVPIHQDSRKYLRFVFQDKILQFRTLCFNLSTAPQVFTRVLNSLTQWLHLMVINVSMYLDDCLLRAPSEEQYGTIFGNGTIFPAQLVLCSAMQWMSLLGTLSSVEKLIKLGKLHSRTRQFYLTANSYRKSQPDSTVFHITEDMKSDLAWWDSSERLQEGVSLLSVNPSLQFISDASGACLGATLMDRNVSGVWTESQKDLHTNVKDLLAVFLGFQKFVHMVEGRVVAINADNSTALSYIWKRGTHSFTLFLKVRELLLWAEEHQIQLVPRFVRGRMNVLEDELSRRRQVL
ncbi:uncharacterized protein LOC135218810 [Macrobrachium nipponense]|uniref:uncharacterized protein LOC135218810 n=1 Tax=Macrobrachium nipponense TaxID=159736 RepID=UPI0030C7C65B